MIDRIWTRHAGMVALCFGTLGALIYVLMITVTLAQIETISGRVPFDLRPLGYSPQDAALLLEGLGVEGRTYYLSHQIPLDTAYPALLALTLISLMRWCAQDAPTQTLVWVGIILAIAAALCDYAENLGIVVMILRWPDLSALIVHASSVATVAKSMLTTAAVIITVLIGFIAAKRRVRPAS